MPKELQVGGKRMMAAVGQPCPYCTRVMGEDDLALLPTRDHIKPRSRFGPAGRKAGRWIPVCEECNLRKRDMTLEELLDDLVKDNSNLIARLDLNVQRIRCIRYLLAIGLE